jgi:hypothetical protein
MVKCPDCGQECKARGLHFHQKYHCTKAGGATASPSTSDDCKHDWKMLRPLNPQFAAAMEQGYKKICMDCGEIE